LRCFFYSQESDLRRRERSEKLRWSFEQRTVRGDREGSRGDSMRAKRSRRSIPVDRTKHLFEVLFFIAFSESEQQKRRIDASFIFYASLLIAPNSRLKRSSIESVRRYSSTLWYLSLSGPQPSITAQPIADRRLPSEAPPTLRKSG